MPDQTDTRTGKGGPHVELTEETTTTHKSRKRVLKEAPSAPSSSLRSLCYCSASYYKGDEVVSDDEHVDEKVDVDVTDDNTKREAELPCEKCNEDLTEVESYVDFHNHFYHDECFVCTRCETNLSSGKQDIWRYRAHPYCKPCYMEEFGSKLCSKCNKYTDDPVELAGRKWHRECLHCDVCQRSLVESGVYYPGKTYETGKKIYCKPCFLEKFMGRCFKCAQTLTGIVYKLIGDRRYHERCFKCVKCYKQLEPDKRGEWFLEKDDELYCLEHHRQYFLPKCGNCSEAILEEEATRTAFGKLYHVKCFKCTYPHCDVELKQGQFDKHPQKDSLLCRQHFRDVQTLIAQFDPSSGTLKKAK